jgi:hypothetical protein
VSGKQARQIQELTAQVGDLRQRVTALEDELGTAFPIPVLPNGLYRATIEEVERKTARSGRTFWAIRFHQICSPTPGGSRWPRNRLWANIVLAPRSVMLAKLIAEFDLPMPVGAEGRALFDEELQRLVGRRVELRVRDREHWSRENVRINDVSEVRAA